MQVNLADIQYTLCFLTHEETVLMLHRRYPPNQGLWNGVGGHIEGRETPTASCLREIHEETGYALQTIRFAGLLTWCGFEISEGGLYLFTASAPTPDFKPSGEGTLAWKPFHASVPSPEGTLAWKPFHFVFTSPEVVSNIHIFGPQILNGAPPQVYHFEYDLIECLTNPDEDLAKRLNPPKPQPKTPAAPGTTAPAGPSGRRT